MSALVQGIDLADERDRLASATRKGIGMPMAGLLYWIAVAVLVRLLPMKSALIWSFVITGPVFPAGVLLTRFFGGNLLAKSTLLTPLGMLLAAMQLLYWPVIVIVFRQVPEWTPLVLALLFGSHFLPYMWLYKSPGYGVLAVLTTLVLSGAAIVAGGPLYHDAPLIAAGCYSVSIAVLLTELRRPFKGSQGESGNELV